VCGAPASRTPFASFAGGRFGSVSKWRTNIAELGLCGYGYSMCARLLSGGEGYEYVGRIAVPSSGYNLFTILFIGDAMVVTFTIRPKNGKHFPYGHDVEPD